MNEQRVTVVMPAFNAASTIESALASILGQIRLPDEVIVVDDHSTDDTAAIVQRWISVLPIRLLKNEQNIGCGHSRALAIAAATGDVIATLDADDIWLPDHLRLLVPLMTDPSVIVATRPIRWAPGYGLDTSRVGVPPDVPDPTSQEAEILRYNFLFVGSLFSRLAIEGVGGGSLRRTVDDWDVWIRLIVAGGCRAVAAPHETVLYRSHSGSLSSDEGCLPDEIRLYEDLLALAEFSPHVKVLTSGLRRRRARATFLQAVQSDRKGLGLAVRATYLRAALQDRSLRGGLGPGGQGSVTIRGLLGALAPSLARRLRDRRLVQKRLQPPADQSDTRPFFLETTHQ